MPYNSHKAIEYVCKRRIQLKQHLAKAFGNKCCVCGYSKCIFALEFHHSIPGIKEFGMASMVSKSINAIVKEVSKCVMICSNCHKEVHAGISVVDNPIKFDEDLFWYLRKNKDRILDVDKKTML